MLVLASGERRFPYYGHGALMRIDAIAQHQVVQKTVESVEIRLVVRRPLTPSEEAYLREAAANALGAPFKVELSYCDAIARDASGKYAEFYSEVGSS